MVAKYCKAEVKERIIIMGISRGTQFLCIIMIRKHSTSKNTWMFMMKPARICPKFLHSIMPQKYQKTGKCP